MNEKALIAGEHLCYTIVQPAAKQCFDAVEFQESEVSVMFRAFIIVKRRYAQDYLGKMK